MESTHNFVYLETANAIKSALDKNFDESLSIKEIYSSLGAPPKPNMGHLAFPCFPLARSLKKNPAQIANELAALVSTNDIIKEAKPAGPYLNFNFHIAALAEEVLSKILDQSFFNLGLEDHKEKFLIEYSQPNTHKEMHVGHMRNLCFGYSVAQLLKYIGHDVVTSTYPGDIGTHVAKCLWFLKKNNLKPGPDEDKGTWLGKVYTQATKLLDDELGTDKEEQNRSELTQILKDIEQGSGGVYYKLWQETRQWSLDLMNEVYQWAGVDFDRWYFESEVDSSSLEFARKMYDEGKLVKSEGAIGMDLSEEKLGFCILIKSDGTGMYSTKDVALAHKKFEEYKIDQSLYVVDKRQAHHFKQIFAVLKNTGFTQAEKCIHLQYDFVELPSGAMSSRKGNIVPIKHLIDNMEQTIRQKFLDRYQDFWEEEEIANTARAIANGAIKYGMCRMDPMRKIVFDLDEWLKLDGETGPYLQYVVARINSLTEKYLDETKSANFTAKGLGHDLEEQLVMKLSLFNTVAYQAFENYRPSTLCTYLFELAKLFNSFYAECPIGVEKDDEIQTSRLFLSKSVASVIEQGLKLIGVDCPRRM